MVGRMSYNSPRPELFARSLRRRLQSLTPERVQPESPMDQEEDAQDWGGRMSGDNESLDAIPGETEEERIRRILDRGLKIKEIKENPLADLVQGITFPPNRFVNGDLVRAKFRSETDLFPALEHHEKADDSSGEDEDEVLPAGDVCDSDLFFDFDIGSPEDPPENDEERIINQTEEDEPEAGPEPHQVVSDSDTSSNSPTLLDTRAQESHPRHSPSTTEPSTAYGSTSSGLYSDADVQGAADGDEEACPEVLEGVSLLPEDWLKNQQVLATRSSEDKSQSVTPVVSPPSNQANKTFNETEIEVSHEAENEARHESEIEASHESENGISHESEIEISHESEIEVSHEAGHEAEAGIDEVVINVEAFEVVIDEPQAEENGVNDTSSNPIKAKTSEDTVTICIGQTEKAVAHSKLQALLAQLERGSEYLSGEPKKSRSSSQVIAPEGNLLGVKSPLGGRCQSTMDMTDFDKSKVTRSSPKSEEVPVNLRTASKSSMEDVRDLGDDNKKEKYRKCSSLKTGKTPPGTPGRRKIVRFADVFGLDLADVKTFLDEVPHVPKSAFSDLKDAELSDMESDTGSDLHFSVLPPTGPPSIPTYTAPSIPTMAPLFNQPSGSSEFFNHLRDKKVCLENAYMSDASNVKGVIRVVNLDFNKKVIVKVTMDEWTTTAEVVGEYVPGSCDGFSDKFGFSIDYTPISGIIGKRLEFCIRYECASNEYWDNNFGKNYIFQCFGPSPSMTKSVPIPTGAMKAAHPVTGRSTAHFATFSHSPSTLNEDPWQMYL